MVYVAFLLKFAQQIFDNEENNSAIFPGLNLIYPPKKRYNQALLLPIRIQANEV